MLALPAAAVQVERGALDRPGTAASERVPRRPANRFGFAAREDERDGKSPMRGLSMELPDTAALPLSAAKAAAAGDFSARIGESVEEDYRGFLVRVGFEPYAERISKTLEGEGLNGLQRQVLSFNRDRLRASDAARELAVKVAAAAARQGWSEEASGRVVELAASLLALKPLDAPARLPPELAGAPRGKVLDWVSDATARIVGEHAASVSADVLWAMHGEGFARGTPTAQSLREADEVRALTQEILLSMYTDVEMGHVRYAGRAMAAVLARRAMLSETPALRARLEEAVRRRGLRLSDFVGDTVLIEDAGGRAVPVRVRTGDIVGSRFKSRRAAEIVFGARPAAPLWLKALREGLVANPLGLWMKPVRSRPEQVAGQPVRNLLRRIVHRLRSRAALLPGMLRGYAHVGLVSLQEADGVAMAWVWESEVDSGEGGIRKVGFPDGFLKPGHHVRLGLARWGAEAVWEEFQRQSRSPWRAQVRSSPDGDWISAMSPEERARLAAIPRERAPVLLAELHRRAVEHVERLMVERGIAYAFGLMDSVYRLCCWALIQIGYLAGAQFDFQRRKDHWNPAMRLFQALGFENVRGLSLDSPVLWLGSLFVDPKVERHVAVELPHERDLARAAEIYASPGYAERDPGLLRRLKGALWRAGLPSFEPSRERVRAALERQLEPRRRLRKERGWRSSFSLAAGYVSVVERLISK